MTEQFSQQEMLQQILQAIREQRESTDERFDRLEARMDRFDARMDRFDARMDMFDARMEMFDARMEMFDARMDRFDARMDRFEECMDRSEKSIQQQFSDINTKIELQGKEIIKLSLKVDQLIDSHEKLHAKVIIHDHDIKRLKRVVRRRLDTQVNS